VDRADLMQTIFLTEAKGHHRRSKSDRNRYSYQNMGRLGMFKNRSGYFICCHQKVVVSRMVALVIHTTRQGVPLLESGKLITQLINDGSYYWVDDWN